MQVLNWPHFLKQKWPLCTMQDLYVFLCLSYFYCFIDFYWFSGKDTNNNGRRIQDRQHSTFNSAIQVTRQSVTEQHDLWISIKWKHKTLLRPPKYRIFSCTFWDKHKKGQQWWQRDMTDKPWLQRLIGMYAKQAKTMGKVPPSFITCRPRRLFFVLYVCLLVCLSVSLFGLYLFKLLKL